VNTDLSEPNTVARSDVVPTDFTWTPFHPWKLITKIQNCSLTPGRPVLLLTATALLLVRATAADNVTGFYRKCCLIGKAGIFSRLCYSVASVCSAGLRWVLLMLQH